MKKALIVPVQIVETGYRIAEVRDAEFEVADPLFWVECQDDVLADLFWYNPIDKSINPVPVEEPEPEPEPAPQPTVSGAQAL